MRARKMAALSALALTGGSFAVVASGVPSASAAADYRSIYGSFEKPFQESGPKCTTDRDQRALCKPAGASIVVLPNNKLVYWDALEGMEDVRLNVVAEYGNYAQNDVSRQLDLSGTSPVWKVPVHSDGGANPTGADNEYLPVVPHNNTRVNNDGDMFCSDQIFLPDGRVLDVGGTSYYLEPGIDGVPYGVSELEGLKNARIYDPRTNAWTQSGSMTYGRWYPSLVTLPSGKILTVSGVTKLLKPVYPDRPLDSGTNVKQTETYDPATGKFTVNPSSADKSLPLYPRLHLLPDGKVYYDAAGQTFNPFGQSVDEALWNLASVYDPKSQSWNDVGIPKFDAVLPGFRGSGFSQQLTLKPPYTKAAFLSAGGVYGVSPGTYAATRSAVINTIDTAAGDSLDSTLVTSMNEARWYGTGVTLPTGQVLVFSGATADEVVLPSSAKPITTPELYDPATDTWTSLVDQDHGRTYHNNAVLLPDGRVLVGGHSPIGSFYAFQTDALHSNAGFSDPFRDPSFEIYSPPNLFYGPRPVITDAPDSVAYGKTFTIKTPDADRLSSVVLVRNPAQTHLIDADQKVVELKVVSHTADSVTVAAPPSANVAVAGPYMLFLNAKGDKGATPSVSRQVFLGTQMPSAYALSAKAKAARVKSELGTRAVAMQSAAATSGTQTSNVAGAATSAVATSPRSTPALRPSETRTVASAHEWSRQDTERILLAVVASMMVAWTSRMHLRRALSRR